MLTSRLMAFAQDFAAAYVSNGTEPPISPWRWHLMQFANRIGATFRLNVGAAVAAAAAMLADRRNAGAANVRTMNRPKHIDTV